MLSEYGDEAWSSAVKTAPPASGRHAGSRRVDLVARGGAQARNRRSRNKSALGGEAGGVIAKLVDAIS
jgi:hypothetical protein